MERKLFLIAAMSSGRLNDNPTKAMDVQEETIVVTRKQYVAVADDFLRELFLELTPDRLPYPGPFTVFITDDVVH